MTLGPAWMSLFVGIGLFAGCSKNSHSSDNVPSPELAPQQNLLAPAPTAKTDYQIENGEKEKKKPIEGAVDFENFLSQMQSAQIVDNNKDLSLVSMVSFMHLWVQELNVFSQIKEEIVTQDFVQDYLADIKECGLSFLGPSCFEGQKTLEKQRRLLMIDGSPYLYVQADYVTISRNSYAFFFPLQKVADQFQSHGQVFIFLLSSSLPTAYTPEGILRGKAGVPLGAASFLCLDKNKIKSLSSLVPREQLRSQLNLALIFGEISGAAQRQIEIEELNWAIISDELVVRDIFLNADPNIFYLFLRNKKQIWGISAYRIYLNSLLSSELPKKLKRELAMELLISHLSTDEVIELIAGVFAEGQAGQLMRGLGLLKNHSEEMG